MKVEMAAALLREHWRTGSRLEGPPDGLKPSSRSEAYAVAAAIGELGGLKTAGWKIAATSTAGQFVTTGTCVPPVPIQPGDHIRMDFGPFGSLSASLT